MRKQLILFFLALFLLAACSSNNDTANVIKKDKMVRLLCDVHLIDGSMALHAAKDSMYKYGTNRYGLLFKKYNVDSAAFKNSMKYYAARPDDMINIYEEIGKLLIKRSDSTAKALMKITERQIKTRGAKETAESKRKHALIRRDSVKSSKALQLKINRRIQ